MPHENIEQDVAIGKTEVGTHSPHGEVSAEVSQPGENQNLVVEVIDDTPPEDRNRKKLDKDVIADVDQEAEQYGEKVKKRISEMKHAVHDERRAREAAERRASEAERVAQESWRRLQAMQQQFSYGEAAYAGDSVKTAQLKVEKARADYRRAYDAGDPDAVAAAAEAMAAAKTEEAQAVAWERQAKQKAQQGALQAQNRGVDSQQHLPAQRQQTPAVDPAAENWARENPWFNKDPEMTAAAWGVHERLTRVDGIDPIRDAKKYYEEIDAVMRRRFPEYEWDDDDSSGAASAAPAKPAKKSATSAVAPVRRVPTGSNPNKVTLTKTQVALAERLGLTPEQYARELVKLNNGA